MAFSPDANNLSTATIDSAVCTWDVRTGNLVSKFKGDSALVTCVALSPGGRQVAAGTEDGHVKRYYADIGQELFPLRIQGRVNCLTFSPDGKELLLSDSTNLLKVFDATTFTHLRDLSPPPKKFSTRSRVSEIALSPHNDLIAFRILESGPFLLTGEDTTYLSDKSGANLRELAVFRFSLGPLVFSTDGTILWALTTGQLVKWDTRTGQEVRRIHLNDSPGSYAISPDGRLFAYDASDGIVIRDLTRDPYRRLRGFALTGGQVTCLAFSQDSKLLACGMTTSTTLVWDLRALGISK